MDAAGGVDMDAVRITKGIPSAADSFAVPAVAGETVDGVVAVAGADVNVLALHLDGVGPAEIRPEGEGAAVGRKDLHAVVHAFCYINVIVGIDGEPVRGLEFAGGGALAAPGQLRPPVRGVFHDARVAVAVGDVNVAGAVDDDGGRLVEAVQCFTRLPGLPQSHEQPAVRVELEHEVAAEVGNPDVIPWIDVQAVQPVFSADRLRRVLAQVVIDRLG